MPGQTPKNQISYENDFIQLVQPFFSSSPLSIPCAQACKRLSRPVSRNSSRARCDHPLVPQKRTSRCISPLSFRGIYLPLGLCRIGLWRCALSVLKRPDWCRRCGTRRRVRCYSAGSDCGACAPAMRSAAHHRGPCGCRTSFSAHSSSRRTHKQSLEPHPPAGICPMSIRRGIGGKQRFDRWYRESRPKTRPF